MTTRRVVTTIALLTGLLAGAVPSAIHAQYFGDYPSEAECECWIQDLAAGGEAAREVLETKWLSGCREEAIEPLAAAIRGSATERDTAFLYRLAGEASQIRDVRILEAALEVAESSRATQRARAAAILVLAAQFGSDWAYGDVEGSALLTESLPDEGICGPGLSNIPRTVENPLPSGSARRVAEFFDPLALHGPRLLRNLARCSRSTLGPGIPPQIDVSRSSIRNRCGATFRVHNNTPKWLIYQVLVPETGESSDLPIQARSHRELTTRTEGAVELRYDGELVDTAEPGRPCQGQGR